MSGLRVDQVGVVSQDSHSGLRVDQVGVVRCTHAATATNRPTNCLGTKVVSIYSEVFIFEFMGCIWI